MKYNFLSKKPAIKRAYRWLNIGASALLSILFATHCIYASYAHTTSENWEDHVFVLDHEWQFKALNPLIGNAIGYTVPLLSVAYVNRQGAERLGADWEGIRLHEAKHIEQIDQFGLLKYYQLDEWKREGVAEYVRGKPTLDLCMPDLESDPNQQAYREYYIVARYLFEGEGLSEEEFYAIEHYPLQKAEMWLQEKICLPVK